MPKKRKPDKPARSGAPVPPRELATGLVEAARLIDRRHWAEARTRLEELDQRFPRQEAVLELLATVCREQTDRPALLRVMERLSRLSPHRPDVVLALAGAHALNFYPALAARGYQEFLTHWPTDERAAQVRSDLASLTAAVLELVAEYDFAAAEALEITALHEEARRLTEQGEPIRARQVAERLLQRRPDFVPALNNISQNFAAEDRLDRAIATAQRALASEPDNVHALSNLTRYLCLAGQLEEATSWAARLKAAPSSAPDRWLKQAEALSFLGDDQAVLDAFQAAEQAGALPRMSHPALLYHLAAVATMRLGQEAAARELWRRALRVHPGFDLAQANLDDLQKPIGERNAPWSYTLPSWIAATTLRQLGARARSSASDDHDEASDRLTRRFVRQSPSTLALVPLLLDRGDPLGREFALRLAAAVKTPAMLAALRDFALGQRGSDGLRLQAANIASEAGAIDPGLIRFWSGGEWREVLLLNFTINDTPDPALVEPAQTWLEEAHDALRQRAATHAEQLLLKVLEIVPDAIPALNNLAVAYEMQGRVAEAHDLVLQIHDRAPDYLFARVTVANLHTERGETEEALALLTPLLARKTFHFSEFATLVQAMMSVYLKQKNVEAARSWLKIWEDSDPAHPALNAWRARLTPSALPFLPDLAKRLAGGTARLARPRRGGLWTPLG